MKFIANLVKKDNILYQVKNGKIVKYSPWMGFILAPLYDLIMEKNIFPRKFGSSLNKHYEILEKEMRNDHGKKILDVACGTGSVVEYVSKDNEITCIDISTHLLKLAKKKFMGSNYISYRLIVGNAFELPFEDEQFDVVMCILALNFFKDMDTFVKEVKRNLKRDGRFVCSVP